MKSKDLRRRGSSSIEVVAATLLAGVVMVAAAESYALSLRLGSDSLQRATGAALARQLMAEIQARRFEESLGTNLIGLDVGESSTSRATWDDLDDYHGLTEPISRNSMGGVASELTTAEITSRRWVRRVVVRHVSLNTPTVSSANRTGLKEIAVIVNYGGKEVCRLVAYRGAAMDNDWIRHANGEANEDDDANRAPLARAYCSPRYGVGTATVQLDATTSQDFESSSLTYRWTLDGALIASSSTGQIVINNPTDVTVVKSIVLTVSDANGVSSSDVVRVVIAPAQATSQGQPDSSNDNEDSGIKIDLGIGGIDLGIGINP